MKLSELINKLIKIQEEQGDIPVTLNDFYTPASKDVDFVTVENRGGDNNGEKVACLND